MKKTVWILVKEMWIPLAIALCWTIYNLYEASTDKRSGLLVISSFTSSFFLSAWLMGQYLRVNKQIRTDDNFSDVKKRIDKMLDDFEERNNHLINLVTGGNGFCYATPQINYGLLCWTFTAQGDYPVLDVSVRFLNVNNVQEDTDIESLGTMFPTLKPIFGKRTHSWSASHESSNYLIFFWGRNGRWVQEVKWVTINNEIILATRLILGDAVFEAQDPVYVYIDPRYPGETPIRQQWIHPDEK